MAHYPDGILYGQRLPTSHRPPESDERMWPEGVRVLFRHCSALSRHQLVELLTRAKDRRVLVIDQAGKSILIDNQDRLYVTSARTVYKELLETGVVEYAPAEMSSASVNRGRTYQVLGQYRLSETGEEAYRWLEEKGLVKRLLGSSNTHRLEGNRR